MEKRSVTGLLQRMDGGEAQAAEELYALLYDELRRLAGGLMGRRGGQTLEPTAVVNEAWMKLAGGAQGGWDGRTHFLGVAAKAMRSVLVDHARARRARKRGADYERVPLDDALELFEERTSDLVELDDALERLAGVDPELARLVELRFFAGLTIEETARALDTSESSVERSWRTARAWLRGVLGDDAPASARPAQEGGT